jgi:predicted DNA-binding transcriptional regulator AlpA
MGPAALTSWKEIAEYLGKGVRTVQRWERELELPVRRPIGRDSRVVAALPAELDEWMRTHLNVRHRPVNGRTPNGDGSPNRSVSGNGARTLGAANVQLQQLLARAENHGLVLSHRMAHLQQQMSEMAKHREVLAAH